MDEVFYAPAFDYHRIMVPVKVIYHWPTDTVFEFEQLTIDQVEKAIKVKYKQTDKIEDMEKNEGGPQ